MQEMVRIFSKTHEGYSGGVISGLTYLADLIENLDF